jgi:hypothetical protein
MLEVDMLTVTHNGFLKLSSNYYYPNSYASTSESAAAQNSEKSLTGSSIHTADDLPVDTVAVPDEETVSSTENRQGGFFPWLSIYGIVVLPPKRQRNIWSDYGRLLVV